MDLLVATQPIFTQKKKVFAYDLFHSSETQTFPGTDSQLILAAFNTIGLDRITDGKPLSIRFTQTLVNSGVLTMFPADKLIVELSEDISADDALLLRLKLLKKEGYQISVKCPVSECEISQIAELADIVRLDFGNSIDSDLESSVKRYIRRKKRVLADNVDTDETFESALKLGCALFQGDFFKKPVIHATKDISPVKLNYLMLIQKVNRGSISYEDVASIISRDVSLTYNLLKLLNSVAFGLRKKVTSIKHAITLLGEEELRKWVSLISLREMGNDRPDELTRILLVRAKFLELLANEAGMAQSASDMFLMGLFSMLDVYIGRPIKEILDELPISPDISKAIILNEGPLKDYLRLFQAYERGYWNIVEKQLENMKIDSCILPGIYLRATIWADNITKPQHFD